MNSRSVAVFVVAKGETPERLGRLVEAVASSRGVTDVELLVAMPADEHGAFAGIVPTGAIGTIRLLANETGERSRGLNICLAHCSAPYVCRLDARSIPPVDYLSRCVERLVRSPEVAVAGGRQAPVAGGHGHTAAAIGRALRNPWLLGGASYRRPTAAGPVDTVYLGAFRTDDLRRVGGWDPALLANEDYELCTRLREAGGVVWMEKGLAVGYEARTTFAALARQYHAFGVAKAAYWRVPGRRPATRQLIALGGASLAALAGLSSVRQPRRMAGLALAAVTAVSAVDHVADPREPRIGVRARAVTASFVVIGGWLSGVLSGVVAGALSDAGRRQSG